MYIEFTVGQVLALFYLDKNDGGGGGNREYPVSEHFDTLIV